MDSGRHSARESERDALMLTAGSYPRKKICLLVGQLQFVISFASPLVVALAGDGLVVAVAPEGPAQVLLWRVGRAALRGVRPADLVDAQAGQGLAVVDVPLLWFHPASHREQWLIQPPRGRAALAQETPGPCRLAS